MLVSPSTYSGGCLYNFSKGCSGLESIKAHPVPRIVSMEEIEKLVKNKVKTGPTKVCSILYQIRVDHFGFSVIRPLFVLSNQKSDVKKFSLN